MSIEIKCHCGLDYRLDDSRAGDQFSCKVCGATMILPAGVGRGIPDPVVEAKPAATAPTQVQPPAQAKAPEQAKPPMHVQPPPPAAAPSSEPSAFDSMGESLDGPAAPVTPPSFQPQAIGPAAEPAATEQPTPARTWSPVADPEDEGMAPRGRQRPPISWCVVRLVMIGLCAGFLFMPWFTVTGADPQTGEVAPQSVAGWPIVKAVVGGLIHSASSNRGDLPGIGDFVSAPDGTGAIVAGGLMMVFGPCVYTLGLLLTIPISFAVYHRDGRGAVWPFAACFAGLAAFVVGWRMIAAAEPFTSILDVAGQVGVSIGASGWAWAMALVLIPMGLIAKTKPDYNLIRAMQWSEQRTNAGPF